LFWEIGGKRYDGFIRVVRSMIEVTNLHKKYGNRTAIEGVSFTVNPGEVMGLLGVNGAGKTTILRILAGAIGPTSGTVTIGGCDIGRQSLAARRQVGYLPETIPLYRDMTVRDFLDFAAAIGQIRQRRSHYVKEAIERCGLTEYQDSLIHKLSQGYRQRLGIAQVIVCNPPVIILDEPTRGLDPSQIIKIRHLIQSLAKDHTILLSSHILAEVQATCERVTIIDRGRVVATDTPQNLTQLVGGQHRYEVECSGTSAQVRDLLEGLSGVSTVEIEASPESVDRLWVVVTASAEISGQIVATLVAQELVLYEIRRSRANLEEVFLALTGAEASD
jgi:ABC-2 type transport system ATP-binding protein